MSTIAQEEKPSPLDFDLFLTHACLQAQISYDVVMIKEYEAALTLGSKASTRMKVPSREQKGSHSTPVEKEPEQEYVGRVVILGVYDNRFQLNQLKLLNNKSVPCKLLTIISLMVQFHPSLTKIQINKGLTADGVKKLCTILTNSRITDVILDDNVLFEGNYYVLIDTTCYMKYLSLARCLLNDGVIEEIASRLYMSNLACLNLSSNKITDEGAQLIADALRTNRKLVYLNLTGNLITDAGAESILNSLTLFEIKPEEIKQQRFQRFEYLKKKRLLALEIVKELLNSDPKEKPKKRTGPKPDKSTFNKPTLEKESSSPTLNTDGLIFQRAEIIAEDRLGPCIDSFTKEETVIKNGVNYCFGNPTLRSLNLSYNNISYLTVKKLYEVLFSQNIRFKKEFGLINVCIEGNNLPQMCDEFKLINEILEQRRGGTIMRRKTMDPKKKPLKLK